MVTRRGRDHTATFLVVGEGSHASIGATDLEAMDRLGVLALDIDVIAQPLRHPRHRLQQGPLRGVIHRGSDNQAQIIRIGTVGVLGGGHCVTPECRLSHVVYVIVSIMTESRPKGKPQLKRGHSHGLFLKAL